jgi:hypothetical protein
MFICKEAKKPGVDPVITFDQPLFWKAMFIIQSEDSNSSLKSIVLRLGGFHTKMSFLGAVGHIMADTGLSETLQTIYTDDTVPHMLSGKAISRSIRGRSIAYNALYMVILKTAFRSQMHEKYTETETSLNTEDIYPVPDQDVESNISTSDQLSDQLSFAEAREEFSTLLNSLDAIKCIETNENLKSCLQIT